MAKELEPAPIDAVIAVDSNGGPLLLQGRWSLWFRKLYDFLAKPSFPKMPTYANNAAALADGLIAGEMYKTASGEVRIVV